MKVIGAQAVWTNTLSFTAQLDETDMKTLHEEKEDKPREIYKNQAIRYQRIEKDDLNDPKLKDQLNTLFTLQEQMKRNFAEDYGSRAADHNHTRCIYWATCNILLHRS